MAVSGLAPRRLGFIPDWREESAVRRGFTLVELLVVIVIIALLLSLLLVAVGGARAVAQRTYCLNNLREIGMATQVYVNARGKYPRAWVNSTCRWMDQLKPYLEKRCAVYQCPNDFERIACTWDPEIILSYGINTFRFRDEAHCFWYSVSSDNVRHPKDVILFADCTPGKYYCGGGGSFRNPVPNVAYRHLSGTFNVAYCDGHAESKTDTVQADWNAAQ